ncbi:MAG: hypothetical protein ACJ78Q_00115 [Chloroflexia bacterium]
MGCLVTLIRFPIGVIAILLAILLHVILFICETIALFISFPLAAVLMSRENLKKSWMGTYPNFWNNGITLVAPQSWIDGQPKPEAQARERLPQSPTRQSEIDDSLVLDGIGAIIRKSWGWIFLD